MGSMHLRLAALAGATLLSAALPTAAAERARDLGVPFQGTPGPLNAITDVKGLEVGHTTLIGGEGKREVGVGPVRTGVTVVLPRGKENAKAVYGGSSTSTAMAR